MRIRCAYYYTLRRSCRVSQGASPDYVHAKLEQTNQSGNSTTETKTSEVASSRLDLTDLGVFKLSVELSSPKDTRTSSYLSWLASMWRLKTSMIGHSVPACRAYTSLAA